MKKYIIIFKICTIVALILTCKMCIDQRRFEEKRDVEIKKLHRLLNQNHHAKN